MVCPSCRHQEPFGTFFCSECGAQLLFLEGNTVVAPSHPEHREHTHHPASGSAAPPSGDTSALGESPAALRLVENGKLLLLEEREFTLGRSGGQQPILPDIDLAPYRAYEEGVSRLHATLKIETGSAQITDLGSVNGTWVNGRKLSAHISTPLEHGDRIQLGNLQLQILIRR